MPSRPETSDRSNRRPPPNYFSRRVQVRLLLLVGCFMLVIILMEEARDPRHYEWMWGDQLPTETSAQEAEPGDVDTKLADTPPPPNTQPGELIIRNAYDAATRAEAGERRDAPIERAAIDAWGRMLGQLPPEQRDALDRSLLLQRRQTLNELDEPTAAELRLVIDALDAEMLDYIEQARASLAENELLEESELAAWQSVLDRLEVNWSDEWRPALERLADDPADNLTVGDMTTLTTLQSLIDELNLAAVKDNTVARPDERYAWNRVLEQLSTLNQEQLEQRSIGVVSFLQLHDQPEDYRGKVVTIRGHAKLGYRVSARKNLLGVDEYRLLWLRPRGGPNTLVAIYCLDTPGLPPLKHKDRDGGVTELDHEVQVTGYFFKRWAYRAQDGLRTAPQLLASQVVVESTPTWTTSQTPSTQTLLVVVVLAGLLGIGLAVVFYALNQWPSRASGVLLRAKPVIDDFDPSQVSPGVSAELAALEAAERDAESPASSG